LSARNADKQLAHLVCIGKRASQTQERLGERGRGRAKEQDRQQSRTDSRWITGTAHASERETDVERPGEEEEEEEEGEEEGLFKASAVNEEDRRRRRRRKVYSKLTQ